MSLSPWDLTANLNFSIAQFYRPRRPSYVFATQTTRQRSGSYQHATGSVEEEEDELVTTTESDFIDNFVRRKQKQRSLSVHQQQSVQQYDQKQMHQLTNSKEKKYFVSQPQLSNQAFTKIDPPLQKHQKETNRTVQMKSSETIEKINLNNSITKMLPSNEDKNVFVQEAINSTLQHSKSSLSDSKIPYSASKCFSPLLHYQLQQQLSQQQKQQQPVQQHQMQQLTLYQDRSATPDSNSSFTNTSTNMPMIATTAVSGFGRSSSLVNRITHSNTGSSSVKSYNPDQPSLKKQNSFEEAKIKKKYPTMERQNSFHNEKQPNSQQHSRQSLSMVANTSLSSEKQSRRSKWRYTKNLVVLSIGFILVFTAFRSVQNLQSSINSVGRLGVLTMSLVHATTFISCLFAPTLVKKCSSKWAIVFGLLFYLFWITANFFPHVATLVPTSIGVGFGQSLAWGAQVLYIERLAVDYSYLSKELTQQELYKFNGIFLACFQSSHIWGNLVSSLLLTNEDLPYGSKSNAEEPGEDDLNINNKAYAADGFDSMGDEIDQKPCGVYDRVTHDEDNNESITFLHEMSKQPVRMASRNIFKLMIAYLVFASVGFSVIFLFLEKLDNPTTAEATTRLGVVQGLRRLISHKTYRFLIPLLVFNGFEQGFVYSDYTKSFICCTVGVQYIGYNMITLGMTNSIFSIGIGVVARHIAREAIVGIGCVLHLGLLVFLLVWIPGSNLVPVFFVISALWGLCDAIWQTQCNCLVNLSCPNDHDIAFQVFRMLQSIGATTAFLLSGVTCVTSKLYVLICLLVLAIVSYVFVEYFLRKNECLQTGTTIVAIGNQQKQQQPLQFNQKQCHEKNINKTESGDANNQS